MTGPPRRSSPSVLHSITEAISENFDSALELARAFGSPVLEPRWWPADVGEIEYVLERWPDGNHPTGDHCRIGSMRHDEIPICVIAHREVPRAGRAAGEWYAPPELAAVRGLIGRVGIPPHLQAVVYRDELSIHLIGYETEDEIMSTVGSLRRISAP